MWDTIEDSTYENTCLQCVGFVRAHQIGLYGISNSLPPRECAKDYAESPPTGYTFIKDSAAGIQEGDLVVFDKACDTCSDCGHIAVVTEIIGGNNIKVAEALGGDPDTCFQTGQGQGKVYYNKPIVLEDNEIMGKIYAGYLRHN